ncbi:MAG: hypothetical protein JWM34_345, partial [Ilumatobacteraceae bacterium]|nr:hypothetical protein [Ilumatobacteraceae bacterium]
MQAQTSVIGNDCGRAAWRCIESTTGRVSRNLQEVPGEEFEIGVVDRGRIRRTRGDGLWLVDERRIDDNNRSYIRLAGHDLAGHDLAGHDPSGPDNSALIGDVSDHSRTFDAIHRQRVAVLKSRGGCNDSDRVNAWDHHRWRHHGTLRAGRDWRGH